VTDCIFCKKEHTPEYVKTMEYRKTHNKWDDIKEILPLISDIANFGQCRMMDKWHWSRNKDCKYIELRIDMRDGGCLIYNGVGKRISPKQLLHQITKENGYTDIPDDEAYS